MNCHLSLTPPQSHALVRLLSHLRSAWLEAAGEEGEEGGELFSANDLELLLPLLAEIKTGQRRGRAMAGE